MMKLLLALIALALCSALAMATAPEPPNCSVLPCDILGPFGAVVLCPATPSAIPSTQVTVIVRDYARRPVPDVTVEVEFGSPTLNVICAPGASWNGTTDAQGTWRTVFSGGGCNSAASACVIRANSMIIRAYTIVKSPDYDGAGANLIVGGPDFSDFLAAFRTSAPGCHDYNNDGMTGLEDFVIFAGAVSPSHGCP